MYTLMILLAAD